MKLTAVQQGSLTVPTPAPVSNNWEWIVIALIVLGATAIYRYVFPQWISKEQADNQLLAEFIRSMSQERQQDRQMLIEERRQDRSNIAQLLELNVQAQRDVSQGVEHVAAATNSLNEVVQRMIADLTAHSDNHQRVIQQDMQEIRTLLISLSAQINRLDNTGHTQPQTKV